MHKRIIGSTIIMVLTVSQVLFSFPFNLPAVKEAQAATRLGLHVTQEELNCWRQRAGIDAQGSNGITCPVKYKITGDVSTNSPGDWTRIVNNANGFVSNPTQNVHWNGLSSSGQGTSVNACVKYGDSNLPGSNRFLGEPLRDAAFAYLVTGQANYLTAVRNELISIAAESGMDFANTSHWCVAQTNDANPFFDTTMYLHKLLYGYSYVRSAMSAADQNTLDTWFHNMGTFWQQPYQQSVGQYYVDRTSLTNMGLSGNGTNAANTPDAAAYCNGPLTSGLSLVLNNRNASTQMLAADIGIMFNDAALIQKGKRYVQEYLWYNVFADGTPSEFSRGVADGTPVTGMGYPGTTLGYVSAFVDNLARSGDTSMYDYVTSGGAGGTAGGSKSIGLVMREYAKYVNRTTLRWSGQATNCPTDPAIALSFNIGSPYNWTSNRDSYLAVPNLYYKDNSVTAQYTRTSSGASSWPSSFSDSPGYGVWGGAGGIYPGVLFMFGQMENVVNPYTTSSPTPTPSSSATASFFASDTATQGTWKPVYGSEGSSIVNDTQSLPSYAQITPANATPYTWLSSTSDTRALQKGGAATDRIASAWYNAASFNVNLNLTDANTHRAALYFLDWDSTTRAQTVDVLDASTNAILDTRSLSSFNSGTYLVWNIKGNVTFRITRTGGANALLSGIFLGSASSPTPTPTPASCSQYTPSTTIPTGFASPYDVVSSPNTNLMNVTCLNLTDARLDLGKGDPLQYIYNQGYLFKTGGSAWNPIPYTSTESLIAGAWYPKSATATVSLTQTELANPSYHLAYICSWTGTNWKCGCRDSACTQSYWMIQSFKR